MLESLFKEVEINQGIKPCLFSDETEYSLDYYFLIEGAEVRYLIKNNPTNNCISETLTVDQNFILQRTEAGAVSRILPNKEIQYPADELDGESLFCANYILTAIVLPEIQYCKNGTNFFVIPYILTHLTNMWFFMGRKICGYKIMSKRMGLKN